MCGFIRSISLFLLIFPFTSGLYFHIGKTERKCFIEEVPDETAVLVNYRAEIYDLRTGGIIKPSSDIGMHVEVKDPFMKTILSRVYRPEGKIIVTSHAPGEHVICLYSHSTKWIGGTQLRVHLNIQVGEHTINYTNVAQQEKLSYLQLRMVQLLDQVESITKELNYQRYREERFGQTSESINQRVFWWSTAQLVILIAMGIWQMKMRHLKSFFEDKKEDKDFDCHLFEHQMSVKGEQIENSKAALLENKSPVQLVQIPAITVERRDEATGEFQGVMQDVIMDHAEEHC